MGENAPGAYYGRKCVKLPTLTNAVFYDYTKEPIGQHTADQRLQSQVIALVAVLLYCQLKLSYEVFCRRKITLDKCKSVQHPPARIEYVSPYLNCCLVNFSKKTVNYTGHPTARATYSLPLTPACLRCTICITIAEKMNDTLLMVKKHSCAVHQTKDIANVLRSLCSHGFENFALRQAGDYHLITDNVDYTKHVPSHMDGKWTEKLRDTCHYYLDEFDEKYLYKLWLNGGENFPKYDVINNLCRSTGVFRDCLNIQDSVIKHAKKQCGRRRQYKEFRIVCP